MMLSRISLCAGLRFDTSTADHPRGNTINQAGGPTGLITGLLMFFFLLLMMMMMTIAVVF